MEDTQEQEQIQDDGDSPVSFSLKLKLFFGLHWRGLVCILTPVIFAPLLIEPIEPYCWVAYALCVMAVYWVTEAIPLPVTALIPLAIFPLADVMPGMDVAKLYCNDTIFVFMGSLMLACAIEQSGLHNRMALWAIRTIGYSHYKLLFAMSFMTMFASMWMTNTAATTMVVPINFALLKVFEDQGLLNTYDTTPHGDLVASDFTTCYFCAATFSATIGGVGTLIGTATNLVFKGLLEVSFPNVPEYLSFPLFSGFSVPYMIVMELLLYLAMIIMFFGFLRPNSKAARAAKISPEGVEAAKIAVEEQTASLGRLSYHEINVVILFSLAVLLFFTRSPQMFLGWADRIIMYFEEEDKKYIRDSSIATGMALVMLWLPMSLNALKSFTVAEDLPKGRVHSVLHYTSMDAALPWSFMFLLGGGFAISAAAGPNYTNLNGVIGDFLAKLSGLPNSVIVLILIIFTMLLTNLASNVAVATVFVPIGMTMATKVGANPLLYNLASGLSASYCFMLPVGTPGNLIVQGAARIATKQMILAGIAPSVITVLITWGAMFSWAPIIWSDLKMDVNNLTWTETTKY
ncbi:sodium:sulfate symporter transmembrane region domain-containing protein [Phthorimaea operculella]|nr:sodium:sulfate symporter transmembrane region domain-containing protein [Phthorimaea operculella]